MIITNWNSSVNTKFFSYSKKLKDNTTVTEYLSGRTVGSKNNERDIFEISCKLKLTKTEENTFWSWFANMGSLAGVFTCSALGNSKFRFTNVPEPQDTDQLYTTLALNIEEVY